MKTKISPKTGTGNPMPENQSKGAKNVYVPGQIIKKLLDQEKSTVTLPEISEADKCYNTALDIFIEKYTPATLAEWIGRSLEALEDTRCNTTDEKTAKKEANGFLIALSIMFLPGYIRCKNNDDIKSLFEENNEYLGSSWHHEREVLRTICRAYFTSVCTSDIDGQYASEYLNWCSTMYLLESELCMWDYEKDAAAGFPKRRKQLKDEGYTK